MPDSARELSFVVLHHTGQARPQDHYDLLLDLPGHDLLFAWRITDPPVDWPIQGTASAKRLPDHRRLYLTYQGPISQNRGQVKRVLTGTAEVLQQTNATLKLHLHAKTIDCVITIPL